MTKVMPEKITKQFSSRRGQTWLHVPPTQQQESTWRRNLKRQLPLRQQPCRVNDSRKALSRAHARRAGSENWITNQIPFSTENLKECHTRANAFWARYRKSPFSCMFIQSPRLLKCTSGNKGLPNVKATVLQGPQVGESPCESSSGVEVLLLPLIAWAPQRPSRKLSWKAKDCSLPPT